MERARETTAVANDGLAVSADVNSSLFQDMMHVHRHSKFYDKTEGQKSCRRWKGKDLRGFMSRLADLASVERKGEPGQTTEAEGEEEECIRLVERLLSSRV
jgi:hypothetical protein